MRPNTAALDDNGREYLRPARVVGELRTPQDRHAALESATKTISAMLGLAAAKRIPFGMPVYTVFMTRPEATKHALCKLLLNRGDAVSLDHCPEYN